MVITQRILLLGTHSCRRQVGSKTTSSKAITHPLVIGQEKLIPLRWDTKTKTSDMFDNFLAIPTAERFMQATV